MQSKKESEPEERKIASRFRQLVVLSWKNIKLLQRNKIGTCAEILMALLFIIITILMRYFMDVVVFNEQNSLNNPVLGLFDLASSSNRSLIYYYPNNTFIKDIVTNAYTLINSQSPNFTAKLMGSDKGDPFSLNAATKSDLLAFISFDSSYTSASAIPPTISYTIYTREEAYYQYSTVSLFRSLKDYLFKISPEFDCYDNNRYFFLYTTVFNAIKHAIDLRLISVVSGVNLNDSQQVKIAQYNCPGSFNDAFKTDFSFFLPILIQFSFIFTLVVNLGYIVVEKESKMKEYLKLLGVKWYIIWIAWFIRIFVPYLVLSILFSPLGMIVFNPRGSAPNLGKKAIMQYTSFITVFSVMFVYSLQVSMFIILLGQIFSKPFVAKVVSVIIWITTAINFYHNLPLAGMYVFTVFPNVALQLIIQVVFEYERSSKSLDYSNLYSNLYNFGLNVGGILAMQLAWTLIYIPIAWYIERIFPGKYGASQPFYFPFMQSYWSSKKHVIEDLELKEKSKSEQYGFEKDPDLAIAISIQNLTKKFRTGFKEKTVVNKMSMNFYENQITGLLGHNGAGKTTTTFMLCGIYTPDAGTAYILGNNIITQMNKIQTSLGFCPQHDILYDDLTVAEHIDLVASIKGYTKNQIKEEILSISKLVGLDDHLKKKSKDLSGGMKRRLSVALAVTGGSKVIILDEPTSGLDPLNRRSLWELIRKFKMGRSIILTTHFMEEADALSDRIAIMNHGQVKCCGSPLFLKNTFGFGYRMTMAKNSDFKEEEFKVVLGKSLKKYNIETNIAAEMTVCIPFDLNSAMSNLFSEIDQNKKNLGVDSYGISSPTIEEVFIKVGSIDLSEKTKDQSEINLDNESLSNAFATDFKRNTGFALITQQIKSLLVKRARIFMRRFILAAFILLFAFLAEAILASIIPGQTSLIDSTGDIVSVGSTQNFLQTILNYGSQTLPYYLQGRANTSNLSSLIDSIYTTSNKPGIRLSLMNDNSLSAYVLSLRKTNMTAFLNDYYAGMSFNLLNTSYLQITGYYSTLAYHSSATVLNEMNNVLLKYYTNNSTYTLTTVNSPLSASSSQTNDSILGYVKILPCIDMFPMTLIDFVNSIIVAFIISILVIHIARERLNGSKQLQMLSGVHYGTYWLANYLFDLTICLINISLMVFILKVVSLAKNDLTSEVFAVSAGDSLGYFFLLLLFSSFAWCSLAYFWSFFFKSDIIGFVVLLVILGVTAFFDVVLVQFLFQNRLPNGFHDKSIEDFVNVFRYIIAIVFPNVTIKRALFDLKVLNNSYCITQINKYLNLNFQKNSSYLAILEPGIGLWLILSVVQFIAYALLIYLMEAKSISKINLRKLFKKNTRNDQKDQTNYDNVEPDVKQEALRIKNSDLKVQSANEPLLVSQLLKVFNKGKKEFRAVDMLSFGVPPRECFGLLGMNGAGKTSTFKILTGELSATSGKAFINGNDIVKERSKARRNLGFCPQFDYLPEYLSVEETFRLFANLRGLENSKINEIIQDLIVIFNLNEFTKKPVQKLSHGNKRKVSAAIAFVGRPSIVILDEPTTGMDPAARRYLWTVIKKAVDLGMSVVLTTHSMTESEALCSRLGIMVNGQFKCLGSIQNLKNKFGKGYSLILKCKTQSNDHEQVTIVEQFIEKNVRFAKIKDKQQETLFYQIENEQNTEENSIQTISELFNLIETNKEALQLETFSLSQTSLEQVFLSIAKEQKNEDEKPLDKNIKKWGKMFEIKISKK